MQNSGRFTFYISLVLIIVISASCSQPTGTIKLIPPDADPPKISFVTNSATGLEGSKDFTIEYELTDEITGVQQAFLYYSADGISFNKVGAIAPTSTSLKFCVPNKAHTNPSFKIEAIDLVGNTKTELLELDLTDTPIINLNIPEPLSISSWTGLKTHESNPALHINTCPQSMCSADALKIENDGTTYFLTNLDNPAAPAIGDANWVSCDDNKGTKYVKPAIDFGTTGAHTLSTWLKVVEDEGKAEEIPRVSLTSTDLVFSRCCLKNINNKRLLSTYYS